MKTHVEELIEKWNRKEKEAEFSEYNKGYNRALFQCIESLKDALLLDEAEKVK